ncbi:NAD(P)-dependent oxidoreductase, partial [bacterium]|nr:NAD(P)-dependent oxidoreductase [bacterium]
DLVVNILVNHAVHNGSIRVFGGEQYRPNLHIDDMCRAYLHVLQEPKDRLQQRIYNVGGINHTVTELAEIVRRNVPRTTNVVVEPTDDKRSYRISSELILEELGFAPTKGVPEAVRDLVTAFEEGLIPNSFDDSNYFNIKKMNELIGATSEN